MGPINLPIIMEQNVKNFNHACIIKCVTVLLMVLLCSCKLPDYLYQRRIRVNPLPIAVLVSWNPLSDWQVWIWIGTCGWYSEITDLSLNEAKSSGDLITFGFSCNSFACFHNFNQIDPNIPIKRTCHF